ncbi:hypothetical protein HZB00_04085 [Candidatus Woesearchaeota archaeon]|nr:hypothetical protein [Candidatus Woesearchaeota archaeon]
MAQKLSIKPITKLKNKTVIVTYVVSHDQLHISCGQLERVTQTALYLKDGALDIKLPFGTGDAPPTAVLDVVYLEKGKNALVYAHEKYLALYAQHGSLEARVGEQH